MDFRNRLYVVFGGIFIASLVAANLIFQKFFTWSPFGIYTFELSVGILPYPVTFLVTDLISELYGKKKADQIVISGLVASIFVMIVVLVANALPATSWSPVDGQTFHKVFGLFGPAVFASMVAYLTAQFIDIRIFHFWKKLTKGKHLWLRNNGSTIISQFVDTVTILLLLCITGVVEWSRFLGLLENGFVFKVMVALADTPFFYLGVWFLKPKVHEDPDEKKWGYHSFKEEAL
ncbi:MAG: queuosine precursor transporter [Planctomycetia bacterium]|nr:queuosine precursor transporter [Planctomycetia bacterium]